MGSVATNSIRKGGRTQRYLPPENIVHSSLDAMMSYCGRFSPDVTGETLDLFGRAKGDGKSIDVYYSGDITLLKHPCVAIVGTREVSEEGAARARRLARLVAGAGGVVVSGLAYGVDTEALNSALDNGGKTIAVIGTPLDKCSPSQNNRLQEQIYQEHLLISQFRIGESVFPSNFPQRNKLMAALSDATVIVEASDSSGTLHQATECVRLHRPLFIMRSVAEDPRLSWPEKFLGNPNVFVLSSPDQLLEKLFHKE